MPTLSDEDRLFNRAVEAAALFVQAANITDQTPIESLDPDKIAPLARALMPPGQQQPGATLFVCWFLQAVWDSCAEEAACAIAAAD